MSSIEWLSPDADLTKKCREQLLDALVKKLCGRCDQAFIFGSFSKGNYHAESDIDLIVIKETSLPFTERALEFKDLFDVFSRIDILVYNREEFERMRNDEDCFWGQAHNLKKII